MTDLASRIADARKKAEAATPGIFWTYRMEYIDVNCVGKPAHEYITTASPFLFIEMADEIDRLRDERDEALAKVNSMLTIPEVTQIIAVGPQPEAEARNNALDEAARAVNEELLIYSCGCSRLATDAIFALKSQEQKP